jgi:hypothetical protein
MLIAGAKRLLPEAAVAAEKPPNQRIKRAAKGRKKRKYTRRAKPQVSSKAGTFTPKAAGAVYTSHRAGATWTSTIKDVLDQIGFGLTHKDLRAEIMKTPLGPKLQASEKSFYGAIGKLAAANHLVRHHGRLYGAEAYQQFLNDVAAGKVIDNPAPSPGQRSPMGEAIKEFLTTRDFGAISSEIVREMSKTPVFEAAIRKNPTHIYNVLRRLMQRGEVTKKGERYLLAKAQQEAA